MLLRSSSIFAAFYCLIHHFSKVHIAECASTYLCSHHLVVEAGGLGGEGNLVLCPKKQVIYFFITYLFFNILLISVKWVSPTILFTSHVSKY